MMSIRYLSLSLLTLVAACSKAPEAKQPEPATPAANQLTLAKDPGAALNVVQAKDNGAADQVTVEGRIYDLTKGFAVAKLMDLELEYCGQVNKEDTCPTPWDYCCDGKEVRLAKSLLIEFRDADGKVLPSSAMPDVRLCDQVKVTGKLLVDEHGNPVLVDSGVFQVERPTLPEYVKWPE